MYPEQPNGSPEPSSRNVQANQTSPSPWSQQPLPSGSNLTPVPPFPQSQATDNLSVHSESPSAGVLILQWLTYAFWGWTILALSILTSTVIYYVISKDNPDEFTAYAIAAVVVLLPISAICDFLYSKHEQSKKLGSASLILIVHAVIFALFGIGAVITAVFAAVSALLSSGDNTGSIVTLLSAIVVSIFYAAVFIRTMNFKKLAFFTEKFTIIMVAVVGIIILMGIFGPFMGARATKDDKLLEDNLSSIDTEINNYVNSNNKLPENLSAINSAGDTKILIDKNHVRYTPNSKPAQSDLTGSGIISSTTLGSNQQMTYFYTNCVTYVKKSGSGSINNQNSSDGYSSYISYYDHPAGEVCYKIKTGY